MRTQLELSVKFARNEQYAVPVMVQGEMGTVHLQIVRTDDDKGRVNVVLETDVLGRIAAEFADLGDRIEGLIVGDSEESTEYLAQGRENFEQMMASSGVNADKPVSLNFVTERRLNLTAFEMRDRTHAIMQQNMQRNPESSEYEVQTKSLYGMAKAFLNTIVQIDG